MGKINRVVWIVLDSVGIGEAPDSANFNDSGADTLGHIINTHENIEINNLYSLGLSNIDGITFECKCDEPIGCFGKMKEISAGKDTTIGHWEMAGIYSKKPFPVFPNGFSDGIIDAFIKETGVPGILLNAPASGTEIINRLGEEHIKTGKPIIYTSADSVFQIACHENVYPPEKLYEMCVKARDILVGDAAVARVIARPFLGDKSGEFYRTSNRRDFSLKPSCDNVLSYAKEAGFSVVGVGKIEDIFAGVGLTDVLHTKNNQDGIDVTLDFMKKTDKGIIFTNLVEFDSTWGHRRDSDGYAKGLEEFDARLSEILAELRDDDMLIITADHGCDPTYKGTDHTREYVPLLVYGRNLKNGVNLGIRGTFADIAQTIAEALGLKETSIGTSFLDMITD